MDWPSRKCGRIYSEDEAVGGQLTGLSPSQRPLPPALVGSARPLVTMLSLSVQGSETAQDGLACRIDVRRHARAR